MNYLRIKLQQANDDFDIFTDEEIVNKLLSPIPRGYTQNGMPLYENHPSCGFRVMPDGTEVFKDLTEDAGTGYNELTLIKKLEELDTLNALKVKNNYRQAYELLSEDIRVNEVFKEKNESLEFYEMLEDKYGIARKVAIQMKLASSHKSFPDVEFIVPTINNDTILSLGFYHPNKPNKWHYSGGTKGSLIVGFDQWVYDPRPTLICEGQKDMLIARSKGFNAICFTNGAQALPAFYEKYFKDKVINIVYDKDEAGKNGSEKLAMFLKDCGASEIKIVTSFQETLPEKGDIWDYFYTEKRSKDELEECINKTLKFDSTAYLEASTKIYSLLILNEAKNKEWLNKVVQSDVQIVSEDSTEYVIPDYVEMLYFTYDKKEDIEYVDKGTFSIQAPTDYLNLMQDKIKQDSFVAKRGKLGDEAGTLGATKFQSVRDMRIISRETIYWVDVEQLKNMWDESDNISSSNTMAFCVGKKPQVGKKYRIRYKVLAHPLEKSKLVIMIENFVPYDDFTQNFSLNNTQKEELKVFQPSPIQSVKDKMDEMYIQMKGYVGEIMNWDIWAATELVWNSGYEMMWGGRPEKAVLDIGIIGDAGTGKSFTYDKLMKLYKQGSKISSENATTIAILGGSTSRSGGSKGYKTTAGELAKQDKGILFFEEFANLSQEIMGKLNEIRSEGKGKVHRVDGTLQYDARLRYIFAANQQATVSKMSYFKSGMIPIKEMFPKPEQRRRFDFILAVGDKKKSDDEFGDVFNTFFFKPELPYPEEYYENRIKWIWSRKPEQIKISQQAYEAGKEFSKDWWKNYWTNEALFGTDALQTLLKLTRIAVAIAGMQFSTEDGNDIIVTPEHFRWAYKEFWLKIYDNNVFKIKEFADETSFTSKVTPSAITNLQKIYNAHSVLLDELFKTVEPVAKGMLEVYYGKDRDSLTAVLNSLLKLGFIETKKDRYDTTIKFKGCYQKLDKTTQNKDIQEEQAWEH